MGYIKKLEGEHIYLAVPKVEDAAIYAKWFSDFDTTDGLGNSAMVVTVEAEEAWIQKIQGSLQFAIIRKEDNTLIGNCQILGVKHIRQWAEVGLFIGEEENRGKKYGQEVLRLLLEFAFGTFHLHNVMLRVFAFNERGIHIYQKIGFREFGRRRESYYAKGRFWDEIYMDILKEEYLKTEKKKQETAQK